MRAVVSSFCRLAPCLALFVAGCSPKYYPVEGQLVYPDGSPVSGLDGGSVIFRLPEQKFCSYGGLDKEGRFRLTSESPSDGTPPGHYHILIAPPAIMGEAAFTRGPSPGPAIDARYSDPEKSDLEVDIDPRFGQKIVLTVERPKKRK